MTFTTHLHIGLSVSLSGLLDFGSQDTVLLSRPLWVFSLPRKEHQDDAGNIISASVAKVNAEIKIQIKDIKGLFSVWVGFFFFSLPPRRVSCSSD